MAESLNKRQLGSVGEDLAAKAYGEMGFRSVNRNLHFGKMGEIDLIVEDPAIPLLVFCEVKYRKTNKKGNALEAVAFSKQKTLSKCALYYLTERGVSYLPCRFDVVGIDGETITLVKNAFDYIG